jgi:hypothetical protein
MNIMRVRMVVIMLMCGNGSMAARTDGVMTVMRLLRLLVTIMLIERWVTDASAARYGRWVNYVPGGRDGKPRRFAYHMSAGGRAILRRRWVNH